MKSETRSFPRKIFRCHAKLALPGRPPLPCRTVDLSLSGLCLFFSEQLKAGQACTVAFEAPLTGRHVPVMLSAKVIYSILSGTDGFRTGIQFAQLDPANEKILAELMV
ncbi:MAG: PilZ domain-containing protein [Bacillota bacterium]